MVVTEPAVLTAVLSTQTPVSCNGGTNGTATITFGGGTAPYVITDVTVGGNPVSFSTSGTNPITVSG